MHVRDFVPVLTVCLAPVLSAQSTEPIDEKAVEFLRKEGLERSQVMEHLSWMCDVHGPRLTGSPNLRRAQAWAQKTFESWGLKNVHTEEWGPFGRGWQLHGFSAHVVGSNPWQVTAYPKAWSSAIPARTVGRVVDVSGMTADELRAADLEGAIVMLEALRGVEEHFDAQSKRFDDSDLLTKANQRQTGGAARGPGRRFNRSEWQRRGQVFQMVAGKHPLAILDRGSKGDYGTIFVTGASVPSAPGTPRNERPSARDKSQKVIPQFTCSVEHYNRLARMLKKGVIVEMALELHATYHDDDPMERNVIAEIPGTDPAIGDEVVMIGAHFDSWHSGTGATDNGCGSAAMMEAMRLISALVKQTGKGPRRTIRIALWSGEEQGLLGSRDYVRRHFGAPGQPTAEHGKLAGYFNMDNGTGRLRGVYMEGHEAQAPIFRAWLRPFHDLGASTLTLDSTGGTDHRSFQGVGLPGFQFIQDPVSYSTRTHHSSMDNWDHAVAADMQQASTIIASFAWHCAQRDEKLPRKPVEERASASDASGRRRGR